MAASTSARNQASYSGVSAWAMDLLLDEPCEQLGLGAALRLGSLGEGGPQLVVEPHGDGGLDHFGLRQ